MSEQEATADFERKNAHYMAIYETVQESEDFSFLKVSQPVSQPVVVSRRCLQGCWYY